MTRSARKQPRSDNARLPPTPRPLLPALDPAPAPRPLLPAALRPLAVVLLAVCVALVVLLSVRYLHHTRAGWLDRVVDHRLKVTIGWHRAMLKSVADLGDGLWVTVATAVLVLGSLAARRWRGAVLAAVSVPAAAAVTEFLLKPLVARTMQAAPGYPQEPPGVFTFPSGHTTGAVAVAAALAVLLLDPVRPRIWPALRLIIAAAAFAAAAAVAVAVVVLDYHYFTDTVGGAAVSIGTVLATALVIDRVTAGQRWRQRFPPAQSSPPAGSPSSPPAGSQSSPAADSPSGWTSVRAGASPGREPPRAGSVG